MSADDSFKIRKIPIPIEKIIRPIFIRFEKTRPENYPKLYLSERMSTRCDRDLERQYDGSNNIKSTEMPVDSIEESFADSMKDSDNSEVNENISTKKYGQNSLLVVNF